MSQTVIADVRNSCTSRNACTYFASKLMVRCNKMRKISAEWEFETTFVHWEWMSLTHGKVGKEKGPRAEPRISSYIN